MADSRPMGVIQRCWACKMAGREVDHPDKCTFRIVNSIKCTAGSICSPCLNFAHPRDQPVCRRGPLTTLIGDLIPSFFRVDYAKLYDPGPLHPNLTRMLRGSAVKINWRIIALRWKMDSSLEEIEDQFKLNTGPAVRALLQEWPDRYYFRVKLLNEVIRFQEQMPDTMHLHVCSHGLSFWRTQRLTIKAHNAQCCSTLPHSRDDYSPWPRYKS